MKFMKYIFSYLPTECYLGFSWKIKQLANIGQYTYNNSIFQSPQNATPKCQQPRSNIPTWKKDKNYQLYVHDILSHPDSRPLNFQSFGSISKSKLKTTAEMITAAKVALGM